MKFVVKNLSNLQPTPDWASLPLFDRTEWKRVRFGDVVENCNETCGPAEAGLERFVAMEHLEPGSLHVRSWGNVADGTTFTRRCRPGQVLFGKRRAYQRKVAVAEFEAVVSGDIYVLAPKDTHHLLPELLPFLCLSERFFQHAVGTSAGSLSPRTNWSSLASFEFDLPPLDQQRRIAEILWAVDEALDKWSACDVELKSFYSVKGDSLFRAADFSKSAKATDPEWQTLSGAGVQVIDGDRGKNYPKDSEYTLSGHCLFLNAGNVTKAGFAFEETKFISRERDELLGKGKLRRGDIVLTTRGTVGNIAFYGDEIEWEHVRINSGMVILRNNSERLSTEFLHQFLTTPFVAAQVKLLSYGSAQQQLTVGIIAGLRIPTPSLAEQERILAVMNGMNQCRREVDHTARSLRALQSILCNSFTN